MLKASPLRRTINVDGTEIPAPLIIQRLLLE
jgi:hypothetical protein